MSLSVGFDTGLKSLLTAQAALSTIGNNIANANTPGYTRRQVILGEAAPVTIGGLSFGTGVGIADIRRTVDHAVEQRLLAHHSVLSRLGVERAGFQQLESLVGGVGGTGLPALLGDVFGALSSLAAHPDDLVGRTDVLTTGQNLAGSLRELSSRLGAFRRDARADAEIRVAEVNRITDQIAELNLEISRLKAKGAQPHGLEDRRQVLVQDLGKLVEVKTIADPNGSLRVLLGGHSLVSGKTSFALQLKTGPGGAPELRIDGGIGSIAVGNGAVAGLLKLSENAVGVLAERTDTFARSLLVDFNRIHATGIPLSGGFASLLAANGPALGLSGAGLPLSSAGLPFPVEKGDLWITVENTKTGAVEKHRVAVDPAESLSDLSARIGSISNLSTSLDADGRLRITAAPGHRFDFSPRLDPNPGVAGAFGGEAAALTSGATGPFALTNGATLQIAVDGGPAQTVTFTTSQFADIANATASEVAAAIASQITGATVGVDHGALAIVSSTTGTSSSLLVTDGAGSPNGALGFSTTIDTGATTTAAPLVTGSYTGEANDAWTFAADGDGTIGVTPGLTVGVFDSTGTRIATLEVGEGYSPGEAIEVKDEVRLALGPGVISKTANDSFRLDVLARSDSSDALVALGLNSFFTGSSASDIAVRSDLAADGSLLSASLTGSPADGGALNRILALQDESLDTLGGIPISSYLATTVADLGFDAKRASDFEEAQELLVNDLTRQREEVSGVSLEEEMAALVRFQQAFEAAGRYVRIVQETTASLLDLVR